MQTVQTLKHTAVIPTDSQCNDSAQSQPTWHTNSSSFPEGLRFPISHGSQDMSTLSTVFLGPKDAPDYKTHHDFSLVILEKKNAECILILVIYWKKTGLVHTKISNRNIIYSS